MKWEETHSEQQISDSCFVSLCVLTELVGDIAMQDGSKVSLSWCASRKGAPGRPSKPVETALDRAAPAAPTAAGVASPGCMMRTKEEGTSPTSPWMLATCSHPSTSCATSTCTTGAKVRVTFIFTDGGGKGGPVGGGGYEVKQAAATHPPHAPPPPAPQWRRVVSHSPPRAGGGKGAGRERGGGHGGGEGG